MSNSKLLMAILGGVAAGATMGLLFAPEAGTETRRKISDTKNKAANYVDQLVSDAKQSWFKAKGKVENEAGVAAEEMDDFIRHIARKGEKMWKKTKKQAKNVADDVADSTDRVMDEGQDFANDVSREARRTGNNLKENNYL
jgi:gas vesicle protein